MPRSAHLLGSGWDRLRGAILSVVCGTHQFVGDRGRWWRERWAQQRKGEDCVLCGRSGIDEDEWGIRVFTGEAVDGFAWKTGLIAGYVVAIWNGVHVAEPTQLASAQAAAYWREVTRIGRAVESCFEPAKVNYLTLGNNVPHLHTHIVPRPWSGDPGPNRALDFAYLDAPRQPEVQVRDAARLLRERLAET